ncbi:MAG: S-layer homology domain-containing protein [Acidobacteria bacterium]|nr:S-layer homology domain-containing protein [Acidobacteriota bacterium]
MSLRRVLAALAALVMVVVLVPAASQPALAASGPWLDEDFQDGVDNVFDSGWGLESTSQGHIGKGIISRIDKGDHWGSSAHWNTKPNIGFEPTEMWMRYWIRFNPGFRVDSPSRGKLPGFGGLYTYNCLGNRPSTQSEPCWSARMSFSPLYPGDGLPSYPYDPAEVTRVGFYAYLLNGNDVGQTGEVLHWDPDLSTLQHGLWYCIEARVKLDDPGEKNGVLQGFVNGQEAFSATNLNFRRSGESQLKVKSLWYDIYYGGSATSPVNNAVSFDSLAAGPSRVGCDDGGSGSGTFLDDDDSPFEKAIEELAASGITKGCNPPVNDRFCPNDNVTRGQMAGFLKRALGSLYPVSLPDPPPSPPDFWGGVSHQHYLDALDVFAAGGAPLDTYVVTYPIDQGGDKDWLATGIGKNPNYWVPIQLDRIWLEGATPYVRLTVDDLSGLNSGAYDQRLANMLASFAAYTDLGGGRRLILDILPDSNKKNVAYGDSPTGFKAAFRKIADDSRARIGSSKVRIAFTAQRAMSSDKYSSTQYGTGGFPLFWPGDNYVDLAGINGYVQTAGSNAGYYSAAFSDLAATTGPGVPFFVSAGGAPADPSVAAQIDFVEALAALAASHPHVVGIQWDDVDRWGLDMRVSSPSGLTSGFAAATQQARTGGLDWLFSTQAKNWAKAHNALYPFDDIETSVFADAIRWLEAAGLTSGCAPTRFCPEDRVTRGQMAAFLARALKLPIPGAPVVFEDAKGHLFEAAISKLAAAGITKGCNPPANDRFCPNDLVTRGQMAAFMVRAGLTTG